MTLIWGMNYLNIHEWLKSYEARTAVKKAKDPPKPLSPIWRGPSCAFTTADGIYEWTACDEKVRQIQPFRAIKTEQEIAELYCEPKAYYCSVLFLREAPEGLFTFNELNKPEEWPNSLSKYLALTGQGELSLAAKQLHRLVEGARKEFRDAQDRAWGHRKLADRTPEDYERKEANGWERFNHQKKQYLQGYKRALTTRIVRRRRARRCPSCNAAALETGERKCVQCRKATRRERNRRYLNNNKLKTGSRLGIRKAKLAIPLRPYSRKRQDGLPVLHI
jgi:hypothetical protein